MESQPLNSEIRNNLENFRPCIHTLSKRIIWGTSPENQSSEFVTK